MRNIVLALLLLVLLCTGCRPTGTPSVQPPSGRIKRTAFDDFVAESYSHQRFSLSEPEIKTLKEMAAKGDKLAGEKLHQYYAYIAVSPEAAEKIIKMAPPGKRVHEYILIGFRIHLANAYYYQRMLIMDLVSSAATGDREAAGKLVQYYSGLFNHILVVPFREFAKGDNSALPQIRALDAAFKRGDLRLIQRKPPYPKTPPQIGWPF